MYSLLDAAIESSCLIFECCKGTNNSWIILRLSLHFFYIKMTRNIQATFFSITYCISIFFRHSILSAAFFLIFFHLIGSKQGEKNLFFVLYSVASRSVGSAAPALLACHRRNARIRPHRVSVTMFAPANANKAVETDLRWQDWDRADTVRW